LDHLTVDQVTEISQLTPYQARSARKFGRRLSRGVYGQSPDGDPANLLNRARAALLTAPPGSTISGLAGLALAGATVPFGMEALLTAPVDVTVPISQGRRPRRPEVQVHRVSEPPPLWMEGRTPVPLAHPAHCWAQVVRQLLPHTDWQPGQPFGVTQPGDLTVPGRREFCWCVQLADALTPRDGGLLTFDEFSSHLESTRGQHGSKTPLRVFRWVRPGTDSPKETVLRLIVLDAGFPEPAVNPVVQVANGTRRLDLGWLKEMIDLEFHGEQHFKDSQTARADLLRRGDLQAAGWLVVETTNADLLDPRRLLARLAAAFDEARRRS
jgi:hypothetical protein